MATEWPVGNQNRKKVVIFRTLNSLEYLWIPPYNWNQTDIMPQEYFWFILSSVLGMITKLMNAFFLLVSTKISLIDSMFT